MLATQNRADRRVRCAPRLERSLTLPRMSFRLRSTQLNLFCQDGERVVEPLGHICVERFVDWPQCCRSFLWWELLSKDLIQFAVKLNDVPVQGNKVFVSLL